MRGGRSPRSGELRWQDGQAPPILATRTQARSALYVSSPTPPWTDTMRRIGFLRRRLTLSFHQNIFCNTKVEDIVVWRKSLSSTSPVRFEHRSVM